MESYKYIIHTPERDQPRNGQESNALASMYKNFFAGRGWNKELLVTEISSGSRPYFLLHSTICLDGEIGAHVFYFNRYIPTYKATKNNTYNLLYSLPELINDIQDKPEPLKFGFTTFVRASESGNQRYSPVFHRVRTYMFGAIHKIHDNNWTIEGEKEVFEQFARGRASFLEKYIDKVNQPCLV